MLFSFSPCLTVAHFLCRGDKRIQWLPKSIKTLLLLCSTMLLAPVVICVYGVSSIICNPDDVSVKDNILRLVIGQGQHSKVVTCLYSVFSSILNPDDDTFRDNVLRLVICQGQARTRIRLPFFFAASLIAFVILVSILKSQSRSSNPSLEAQIPVSRLKSQSGSSNPSL